MASPAPVGNKNTEIQYQQGFPPKMVARAKQKTLPKWKGLLPE
jgi:hypothetical protein